MTKRRNFSDKFKATVALKVLRADRSVQEITAKHCVHLLPTGILVWPSGDTSQYLEVPGN